VSEWCRRAAITPPPQPEIEPVDLMPTPPAPRPERDHDVEAIALRPGDRLIVLRRRVFDPKAPQETR
jgi:hypothetical protein